MSGIAGYLASDPGTTTPERIRAMLAALRRRGPDGEGICLGSRKIGEFRCLRRTREDPAGVEHAPFDLEDRISPDEPHDFALATSRYAVMNRSSAVHQPFATGDGAIVAVFDGEIYNHPELRDELSEKGSTFRIGSSVEVLIEGYRHWGRKLWPRLNGFWAVGLYDARRQTLVLSRDRLGIAPLYYRQTGRGLFFGSNITSVIAAAPDGNEMSESLVQGFIETGLKDFDGRTCWQSVRSLEPGVVVELGPDATRLEQGRKHRYWHYPDRPWTTDEVSFQDACTRFRDLLFDAVGIRLRSDRRPAFELSGGVDSSAVVAAAAVQGAEPVTYTLRVPERDEEPFARKMRERYSVDYRVVTQDHSSFPERAEVFAEAMEEPFRSANVWEHQRLLRRMKGDGAGVVLTGSGSDWVLAGDRYDFWPAARRSLIERGHAMQALTCGAFFRFGSRRRVKQTARWMYRQVPGLGRAGNDGSSWGTSRPPRTGTPAAEVVRRSEELDFHPKRLFDVRCKQLPYALLTDDHLFASIPLEMRTPFLDHRLVELSLRLPAAYLYRRGFTKWVLRKAMEPYLPPEIVWRREKFGFPFPLRKLLRDHREFLSTSFARVRRLGLLRGTEGRTWDEMVADDPQWMWRVCSTGIWARVYGMA